MNKKGVVLGSIFCVLMTFLIFGMGFIEKENVKNLTTLYQVYLNGKKIGLIENEETLYKLIDAEQEDIKIKYGVDKVYPPKGLTITPIKTYDADISKVRTIYDKIKSEAPFTIEGYEVTIKSEQPLKFYILNKGDLNESVRNTVLSFIDKEVLDSYIAGTQPEIIDEGETIDSLSLGQEIKIKEATISTEEYIFTNAEDLSRYMLFGTLNKGQEYTVKLGDDIESVATKNTLSVNEFLIANPDIVSENALLAVGQVVNISLIKPLIDVVEETTSIEKQVIKYETTVEYDPSLSSSTKYVKQEGSNGLVRAKYNNEIVNGVLSSVAPLGTPEEITPTINRILVVGGVDTVYIGDSEYWGWPTLKPYKISSYFGPRWGSWHYGIDVTGIAGGSYGSPIKAIQNGTVSQTGSKSDMGKYVMINHNNGYNSVYMHMSKILVKEGDAVVKSQVIGLMGSTGRSTGTHLHLGVFTGTGAYSNSKMINPLLLYK